MYRCGLVFRGVFISRSARVSELAPFLPALYLSSKQNLPGWAGKGAFLLDRIREQVLVIQRKEPFHKKNGA